MSSGVPGLWKVKGSHTRRNPLGTGRAGVERSYAVSLVVRGQNSTGVVVEAAGNVYEGAYGLRVL